jgi:hypothetical protein
MRPELAHIVERVRTVEEDLAREIENKRLKQSIWAWLKETGLLSLLTAPFLYSLVVPLVLLDIWVSVYQGLAFPVYGLPLVSRRDYLVVDRHKLSYLNAIEKLNCTYCSYANGLIAYTREVAARTEQYWCPIKHARRIKGPHAHYHEFARYGDARGYHALGIQADAGPRAGRTRQRIQLKPQR